METLQMTVRFEEPRNVLTDQLNSLIAPRKTSFCTFTLKSSVVVSFVYIRIFFEVVFSLRVSLIIEKATYT